MSFLSSPSSLAICTPCSGDAFRLAGDRIGTKPISQQGKESVPDSRTDHSLRDSNLPAQLCGFGWIGVLEHLGFSNLCWLVSGAFVLAAYIRDGWKKQLIGEFLTLGVSLGLTGILLYLPFYLGFSSQSRFPFVLPSMVFFTRGYSSG